MSLYRSLLIHQAKSFLRVRLKGQNIAVRLLIGLLMAYFVFSLIAGGFLFEGLLKAMAPGLDPVETINDQLLSILFGLFALRFVLQKPPNVRFQPYLHLPVDRARLLRFFQAFSLLSPHNLLPLCFALPYATVTLGPRYGIYGTLTWLLGLVCLLILSNYATLLLRLSLGQRAGRVYGSLGVVMLWFGLDQFVGTHYITQGSSYVFSLLLESNFVVLLLGIAAADVYVLSSQALKHQLIADTAAHAPPRTFALFRNWADRLGPVGHLLWLEGRLLWRNTRPKHFFLLSLVFSTGYLAFMLLTAMDETGYALRAFVGLLASGSFALNYGQLMFSWESSYFDGLLMHQTQPKHLIQAKLWLLQGSCVALYLLSLPLILLMRPSFSLIHIAFLFFNTGITCILMLLLALNNRKGIDISRSGSFFNYEGFSAAHWLWFIPTAVPPILFLTWMDHNVNGPAWLALIGLGSTLLTPLWVRFFANRFSRKKYRMAAGFRAYAD